MTFAYTPSFKGAVLWSFWFMGSLRQVTAGAINCPRSRTLDIKPAPSMFVDMGEATTLTQSMNTA